MHAGSIDNDRTAAARVYAALSGGGWVSGWDLSRAARTTCVSTRVSEVRAQLPATETIEHKTREGGQYYCLVRRRAEPTAVEQLVLI